MLVTKITVQDAINILNDNTNYVWVRFTGESQFSPVRKPEAVICSIMQVEQEKKFAWDELTIHKNVDKYGGSISLCLKSRIIKRPEFI